MTARSTLFTFVLLLVSILVSLAAGEAALRLLGYAGAPESVIGNVRSVDDAILNWRFEPGSTVRDGKIIYKYNSDGFRDEEHVHQKPLGVTRLVIVGDSVTEGSGVAQDALFSRQLQTLLGEKYEVINLGMSGLNTPQEVHLLGVEGLKYGPDIVVMNFVLNDCDFFSTLRGAEKFQEKKDSQIGVLGGVAISPRLKKFLKSSALIYFLKARVEYVLGLIMGKEEKNYYASLWNAPACRERVMAGFDSLQKLQREYGFVVHVLLWPLLIDYKHYEFAFVHKWVMQIAEERGFKAFDLLPVYSARWYRDIQVTAEDNVHPNGDGHRLAAQAYADWSRQLSTNKGY